MLINYDFLIVVYCSSVLCCQCSPNHVSDDSLFASSTIVVALLMVSCEDTCHVFIAGVHQTTLAVTQLCACSTTSVTLFMTSVCEDTCHVFIVGIHQTSSTMTHCELVD